MKDFIMQDLLSEEIINLEISVYKNTIGDILMNTLISFSMIINIIFLSRK